MFSNRYIFIYATVMVIIVAAILSSAASFLKPIQDRNIRTAKMVDILKSANIPADKGNADSLYKKYIIREEAINHLGEKVCHYENDKLVEGDARPFELKLKEELYREKQLKEGKSELEPRFPLYVCEKDGEMFYIIPLLGKGLWGPVWGNISLRGDFNTVYGVNFGHKGETPGLGAEIDKTDFQKQFVDKKIFDDNGNFKSILVVKGGVQILPESQRIHGVDAISGGTITSNSVSDMLMDCLENYLDYIKTQKSDGSRS
ncbi:MAG: NADH:ubiquinone reductase (Na(+)-transporting) subunit C [Bacteroidales bacterium]|nr:NADH:ubiquinone reductase (Na(+)-transporting) subunit C [Bacteroidales bacterium]